LAIRIPQLTIAGGTVQYARQTYRGEDGVLEVTHPAVGGGQLRLSKHRVHAARAWFKKTASGPDGYCCSGDGSSRVTRASGLNV
jgi:hypothetical protein